MQQIEDDPVCPIWYNTIYTMGRLPPGSWESLQAKQTVKQFKLQTLQHATKIRQLSARARLRRANAFAPFLQVLVCLSGLQAQTQSAEVQKIDGDNSFDAA